MIIVMKPGAAEEDINKIIEKIRELGYAPHALRGVEKTIVGAVGNEENKGRLQALESMRGVESVVPILKPYKLAGREFKKENTIVDIAGGLQVGGKNIVVMAGPCSVENREQILESARAVKAAGGNILRGGAFKPRTSPYAFQGLEEEGLKLLAEAKKETGLPIVTEVVNPNDMDLVADYADIMQVGARNVQNFTLLKLLGQCKKPILLKRGMMTTIKEFIMSAEYIMSEGNRNVILCERGIRTFETATRNTLDISAIPVLRKETHLPIVIDPSHATGHWEYIHSMAMASVAAGADGIIVEVHPKPEDALSDGAQSLKPAKFKQLMVDIEKFAIAAGRGIYK